MISIGGRPRGLSRCWKLEARGERRTDEWEASTRPLSISLPKTIAMPSFRWIMLGLVWMLYASFGLVSNSMAPLVTDITRDLQLDFTRMGTVLGAWQLVYIIVASSAGFLIDRMGLRK